ncbi:MAG: hypothetical protein GEU73_11565 [Chloroflexi bacterium]|nr:hypothetical protein [Chloroflexota bacterium]
MSPPAGCSALGHHEAAGEDREGSTGVAVDDQATGGQPGPVEIAVSRVIGALHPQIPDVTVQPHNGSVEVLVPPSALETAARILRDQLGYVYLSMVTAVDFADHIEIVYLTYALDHPHGVFLKAKLPREDLPECPSLTATWPGAEFQERETYDLMGINFVGHPDLTRILLEDDFPGYPLRKDFSIAPDYVLMRHLRSGADGSPAQTDEEDPSDPQGTDPSPRTGDGGGVR